MEAAASARRELAGNGIPGEEGSDNVRVLHVGNNCVREDCADVTRPRDASNGGGNVFKIMIATDTHLGYKERDAVRGEDSFTAFEEVLKKAKELEVDFILHGGDLFHDNKPSRPAMFKCMQVRFVVPRLRVALHPMFMLPNSFMAFLLLTTITASKKVLHGEAQGGVPDFQRPKH